MQEAILKARRLAEKKLSSGRSADEFVEIAEADGFKIYVAAGRTITKPSSRLHENRRDIFILVLEGEMHLTFENEEKRIHAGECIVLPKHVRHACVFPKMTIVVEGVYEKGL